MPTRRVLRVGDNVALFLPPEWGIKNSQYDGEWYPKTTDGTSFVCRLPCFVNSHLPCPHTNSLQEMFLPLMHHRCKTISICRGGAGGVMCMLF